MEIKNKIRNLALKNAISFKGRANPGAIIGKIIGDHPEWKDKKQELVRKIKMIVDEVNCLSIDDQTKALQ